MDFLLVGGFVWFIFYIPFVVVCSIIAILWYFVIKPMLNKPSESYRGSLGAEVKRHMFLESCVQLSGFTSKKG